MTIAREYAKNQQHKRDLAAHRQEQELRWKEEDRAVRLAASARNSAGLDDHAESMRRLAGLSYVTLRCHEDTWTFIARAAFGQWEPSWTQSEWNSYRNGPDRTRLYRFTIDPNLPDGRIRKTTSGMQDVFVSGHNLVRILDTLHTAARSDDLPHGCRARTLYEKIAAIAAAVDRTRLTAQSTGVVVPIDDSLGKRPLPELPRNQFPDRAAAPPVQAPGQRPQRLRASSASGTPSRVSPR
ncbi:hypothetical protein ABZ896_26925 [Streptomyces sp. NPDC047072]|uniref:hypothetical protein n=1 Tax=Streptomyces sp. NPDC047072 TaxID=3154809 RepID=UPI0033C615EA